MLILTDCKNDALSRGTFPDNVKFGNITPVHKKVKVLIKKIIGQWVYYLYVQKSLKMLFMINSLKLFMINFQIYEGSQPGKYSMFIHLLISH